jgi:hypothetical protein
MVQSRQGKLIFDNSFFSSEPAPMDEARDDLEPGRAEATPRPDDNKTEVVRKPTVSADEFWRNAEDVLDSRLPFEEATHHLHKVRMQWGERIWSVLFLGIRAQYHTPAKTVGDLVILLHTDTGLISTFYMDAELDSEPAPVANTDPTGAGSDAVIETEDAKQDKPTRHIHTARTTVLGFRRAFEKMWPIPGS